MECYTSTKSFGAVGENDNTLPTETCKGRCYIRTQQNRPNGKASQDLVQDLVWFIRLSRGNNVKGAFLA